MDPFISPELAATIDEFSLRGFATAKLLGDTYSIVLQRVNDEGVPTALAAQEFLIEFARREATSERENVTRFMGADGEMSREEPANIRPRDTFRLPAAEGSPPGALGPAGVVTIVLPAEGGIVRAAFELRV